MSIRKDKKTLNLNLPITRSDATKIILFKWTSLLAIDCTMDRCEPNNVSLTNRLHGYLVKSVAAIYHELNATVSTAVCKYVAISTKQKSVKSWTWMCRTFGATESWLQPTDKKEYFGSRKTFSLSLSHSLSRTNLFSPLSSLFLHSLSLLLNILQPLFLSL